MIPAVLALFASASAAPVGPTDSRLPWHREVEGSFGLGSAANSHSDRPLAVGRLAAGWRWNRFVGIELVGTLSPDLAALTPAMTFRPVRGRVEPVVSAGLGVGMTSQRAGCGGPFDGMKGCGWARQARPFEESFAMAVARGSLGVRLDVDPVWVTPQLDAQLLDGSPHNGWELGFTVSVGLSREQNEGPQWVLDTQERLQDQRLERVRVDFYNSDRGAAVEAWHIVMDEVRRLPPGFRRSVYESYVVEVLGTGLFSQREAAQVYQVYGDDLDVLRPALAARPMDCTAAARAIRVVGDRTGQRREAAELLVEAAEEGVTCDVGKAVDDLR